MKRKRVEEGESSEEAVLREMKEETNIDIAGCETKSIRKLQTPGFGPEEFFLIDMKGEEINFQDEHPENESTKLLTMNLEDMFVLDNVFPKEIVENLRNLLF